MNFYAGRDLTVDVLFFTRQCLFLQVLILYADVYLGKGFKNGPRKICGRQPLKNLK